MQHRILSAPGHALVEVDLAPGESVVADAGAMAWMTGDVETETSTRGGILTGLKRKLLTGESFFQNTFRAGSVGGSVGLAPGSDGDIVAHRLGLDGNGDELFLEKGAYLASAEGVRCNAKWGGLKGLFNEGLFVLKCSGVGDLWFHAYGAVHEVVLDGGDYVVDTGFVVAWDPTLDYRLEWGGRIRAFLFSDQLLLRFSGHGRVWVQTRSSRALASWVHPFRRVERRNTSNDD
jgi:uncharacterized protein (TIGR00266 family)